MMLGLVGVGCPIGTYSIHGEGGPLVSFQISKYSGKQGWFCPILPSLFEAITE